MAASTHASKKAVIAALELRGVARPIEIAKVLGPDWLGPQEQVKLRQLLGRMTRAHLLTKTGHGDYSLSPNYRLRGISVRERTEKRAIEFLRKCGGIARTKEIHLAVGNRPIGGLERGYGHKQITETLKASVHIRQDFGRGYWNLDDTERERLPLLGRWADYQIQVSCTEGGLFGFDSADAKRSHFFDSVGSAYIEARGDRSIVGVASNPAIRAALKLMAGAAPSARGEAFDALRDEIEEECCANGVTDAWIIAQEVRKRKPHELYAHLYALFELGNVALHSCAPVELYTSCAAFFGVCPARLSRGEVVALNGVNSGEEIVTSGADSDGRIQLLLPSSSGVK